MSRLVVIVGATASGKSALALQVAQRFNGEIICADSRTIYRGMDIGTAKPTLEDRQKIRHHLLDIVDPGEQFNAALFKSLANQSIEDVTTRDMLPILVGGTGLYIDSVIFDYKFGLKADTDERRRLETMSVDKLQAYCSDNYIELPKNIRNKRHLVRTIERRGVTTMQKELRKDTIVVGIATVREVLRQHIEHRVRQMFADGIVEEARRLGDIYGWTSEAMKANIYRICKVLIDGSLTQQTTIELAVKNDMQLAKRQRTWFKRNPYIYWSDKPEALIEHISKFLHQVPDY